MEWAYREPVTFGYCPVPDGNLMMSLPAPMLKLCEEVLCAFHVKLKGTLDEGFKTDFEKAEFFGTLDAGIAGVLLTMKKWHNVSKCKLAVQKLVGEVCRDAMGELTESRKQR